MAMRVIVDLRQQRACESPARAAGVAGLPLADALRVDVRRVEERSLGQVQLATWVARQRLGGLPTGA
jgi:hypothetical protein